MPDDALAPALLEVRFRSRESIARAGDLLGAAAAVAGLPGEQRTQFAALADELLHAVLLDSFDDTTAIDITVSAHREPGALTLAIEHRGLPSQYTAGSLPQRVEALIGLGFADSLEFLNQGTSGTAIRVSRALSVVPLTDDSAFIASVDSEPAATDPASAPIEYRLMTPDDVVGVARLYYRAYGFTKVGTSYLYEPETFAGLLLAGKHVAFVAADDTGRIVGHAGFSRDHAEQTAGAYGPIATDPAYRQRGIARTLATGLLGHLFTVGIRSGFSEAVTAHTATQGVAANLGGKEVAVVLGRQPADLVFEGFEDTDRRRSVVVYFASVADPQPATVHVPPVYQDLIGWIYATHDIPRTIAAASLRAPADLPEKTVFDLQFVAGISTAVVRVRSYGRDFTDSLQALFTRLDRDNYEVALLRLPLSDPATAYFGGGLSEFGVSVCGVLPEYDDGDFLSLVRCTVPVDVEGTHVDSETARELLAAVAADHQRAWGNAESRARSRARLARIYEAL